MSNAPVYYALAQARFNPILAMAKYVDQIQDRLRQKGYPLIEQQKVMHLRVPVGGQNQKESPQIEQADSWLITRNDRESGFVIGTSGITFHSTHYHTHQEFIANLWEGLQIVQEILDFDHVTRLGLRYLNAVLPQEEETVESYLINGVHGISFNAKSKYFLSESVFDTDVSPDLSQGTLVARVFRANAPLGFPADMMPAGLNILEKFQVKDPIPHAVIDIDHYVQGSIPINNEKIGEYLILLHATLKNIFLTIATNHAKSAWS